MHLSSLRRVVRSVNVTRNVTRTAFALAGVLGMSLIATQIGGAGIASASGLTYHPGYAVEGSWLCYGWTGHAYNIYHCTQHWHRAGGRLVSDNPAWVPNVGGTVTTRTAAPAVSHVSHASHVSHVAAKPNHSAPAAPASGGSVQGMIQSTFGPYAGAAMAVARCESGLNPNAVNRSSGATGVFQFLASTWSGTSYAGYSRTNAWANVHAAYQVFTRDGHSWREWSCQP